MTPAEQERLAAVEVQLAAVSRELRATRFQLTVLRQLLTEDDPEVARAEQDAERILNEIREHPRPVLRVLEGGRSGEPRTAHGRDRHGLRAV